MTPERKLPINENIPSRVVRPAVRLVPFLVFVTAAGGLMESLIGLSSLHTYEMSKVMTVVGLAIGLLAFCWASMLSQDHTLSMNARAYVQVVRPTARLAIFIMFVAASGVALGTIGGQGLDDGAITNFALGAGFITGIAIHCSKSSKAIKWSALNLFSVVFQFLSIMFVILILGQAIDLSSLSWKTEWGVSIVGVVVGMFATMLLVGSFCSFALLSLRRAIKAPQLVQKNEP